MNANLSYFLVGIQTPAEIEKLSLRSPRPVAIYQRESEATATRFYICAKAKRQQQHMTE